MELLAHPSKLLEAGKVNQVPAIIGSNHDEGAIFTEYFPRNADFDDIIEKLVRFPFLLNRETAGEAIQLYRNVWGNSSKEVWAIAQHILGDVMFSCPARHAARSLAAKSPTYLYSFEAEPLLPCLGKSLHGW